MQYTNKGKNKIIVNFMIIKDNSESKILVNIILANSKGEHRILWEGTGPVPAWRWMDLVGGDL
jgi:hypothetical protein